MGKAKKKVDNGTNIDEMQAQASESDPAMAARLALNIKVLKRHDSSIDVIIDHASFVVLYKYEGEKWGKTGAEGPMFLYHRTQAPHYGLFLLNRNGVENFSASFSSADNLDLTPDLIMYQMEPELGPDGQEEEEGETFGIWIFEKEQKDRIGKLMLELHEMSIEDEPSNSSPSTHQVDQFSSRHEVQQNFHSNPSQNQFASHPQPQPNSGLSLLNSIFQSASSTTPTLSNASIASPSPSHQSQSGPPTAASLMSALSGNGNNFDSTNGPPGSDSAGLKALLGLNSSSHPQQPPQFSPNLQHQFPPPPFQHQQQQFQNQVPSQFNQNQQHQQQQHPNGLEALFASARMKSPSPASSPIPTPAQVQPQSQPQPQQTRPRTPTAPASFSNQVNKSNSSAATSQTKTHSIAPPTEPKALRNNGKPSPSQKSTPNVNGVASNSREESFPQIAASVVDGSLAARGKNREPTLEKREFVREVLGLIHTDPKFVDDLFSRYLERMK